MQHRRRLLELRKSMTRSLEEELHILQGAPSREIASFLKAYKKEFKSYNKISKKSELIDAVLKSDIVFNGDYHTLKQSQRIPIRILREVVKNRPKIVLATEVVMMKHQRHLDDFMEDRTTEEQFLERIDYKKNWGFEWKNFLPWFDFAKKNNLKMVGLNTGKTGKNLKERDKRGADLIVGLSMLYPKHLIYAIFGDLHMGRDNLPGEVAKLLTAYGIKRKILTIFENSETIYWLLANKGLEEKVDVVKLRAEAYCVLNVPPWVKLQSHTNWIEQNAELQVSDESEWHDDEPRTFVDYTDQVYSYIQTIANYFDLPSKNLDSFSVYTMDDFSFIEKLEKSKKYSKSKIKYLLSLIEQSQSFFIPGENIIYLVGLSINGVAEEATKFIYSNCSGFKAYSLEPLLMFLQTTFLESLGYFGSKLINHKRKCDQIKDFKLFLKRSAKFKSRIIKDKRLVARGVILLNKKEIGIARGKDYPQNIPKFIMKSPKLLFAVAKNLGAMYGERLYKAMVEGDVNMEWLKSLFSAKINTKEHAVRSIENIIRTLAEVKSYYKSKIENL